MAGTREGGLKTAATNKAHYGHNFYKKIGARGGEISRGGGFGSAFGADPIEAGRKGGSVSRRTKNV